MNDPNQNINLKPEPQHLLQHEFSVIAFLDYLSTRPFDLLYQEKVIEQYQSRILGELVSVRSEIRDSWADNKVEDSVAKLLAQAEQIAREGGFNQSIRRQSMKILLPLMIGFFALSFCVILFVPIPPDLFWITYVIYAALLIVICFVPRYINQRLLNRWQKLSTEKGPLVQRSAVEPLENIQRFVQFLIDDIRKICTVNKLDLANYRLMLFNNKYQNVKVLQEEFRKGVKFYIMELLPGDREAESKGALPAEKTFDEDFERTKP
jgi:hypothetical protein